MIHARWRRIERLFDPDAERFTLGPKGARCDDDSENHLESPLAPSSPPKPTPDGVETSDTVVLQRDDCFENGADAEGRDHGPLSETRTPFLENHMWRRLPAPSSLRVGESCATTDPEYRQIFGSGGCIQRCVEQFIEARFSPQKALRSDRRDRPPRDLGRTADKPADVCVVAGSRISHAA